MRPAALPSPHPHRTLTAPSPHPHPTLTPHSPHPHRTARRGRLARGQLDENASTVALLAEHGYEDLVEAAYLLATTLPKNISIPLEPGGSSTAINTTLERLVQHLHEAQPVELASLPRQEAWLRGRTVKAWANWSEALADHVTFTRQWLSMLDAYVGPNAIEASCIEAVMLTVNSVNACPFCSGLHLDLGRMAGLSSPTKLNSAKSTDDSVSYCGNASNRPAVAYARVFAMADGRGQREVVGESDNLARPCPIRRGS